jgi:hypothetical protein
MKGQIIAELAEALSRGDVSLADLAIIMIISREVKMPYA